MAKRIWTPKIENVEGSAQIRSPIKEETSELPAKNGENRTKILIVNVHEQKYGIVFRHCKQKRVINSHLENSLSCTCCCDCKNIFFHSQQKLLMLYIGESSSQTSEDYDQEI
ncbi:Hypothetical predicted protein [Cloeon dipterum]|uniref:Uncharacterized protein n=1 Tax=Cloeon dipterum TaxID=197152 RepID=A0A8S1DS26_9INSE|nr:Hypothetical predicted protein [Cloeon dipterum]